MKTKMTIKEFRKFFKKTSENKMIWEINYMIEKINKEYYIPTKKALAIELLSSWTQEREIEIEYEYTEELDRLASSLFSKYIDDTIIDRRYISTNCGNTNVLIKKQAKC